MTTRWSVVSAAREPDSPEARAALSVLCRSYWVPLYAYVRRRISDEHEAQDLTQEFFTRLLERNDFGAARSDRGRFRSFLLGALKHFLANEWDRARAQKRGGGRPVLSLDFTEGETQVSYEPEDPSTPDQVFEREWARRLLQGVLDRLRQEVEEKGRTEDFEKLKAFLIAPPDRGAYAGIAERLGVSEGAARMAVHRLRERYRAILREEISHTVDEPGLIESEIQNLFDALRS